MARKECVRMVSHDGDAGTQVKGQRRTIHLEKKRKYINALINKSEAFYKVQDLKHQKSRSRWKCMRDSARSVKNVWTKMKLVSHFFGLLDRNKELLSNKHTPFLREKSNFSASILNADW